MLELQRQAQMTKSKTDGLDQDLLLLAKEGDPEAQVKIAECYMQGIGVEKDEGKAFKWFEKAARQGHVQAQYTLGLCYEEGRGVWPSHTSAEKWYKYAADQGHAGAQFKMGKWYDEGYSPVTQNKNTALKWYKKAAQQGNADAQFALYQCYGDRGNSYYDEKESIKWLETAANNNQADALRTIATGFQDKSYDYQALEWYEKAAKQNDARSQFLAGAIYYNGWLDRKNKIEREEDLVKAAQWFASAAEKNNEAGIWLIGHCYYNGNGVEKDLHKAFEWFLKAYSLILQKKQKQDRDYYGNLNAEFLDKLKEKAEMGSTGAQYEVGVWYYYQRKIDEAINWFLRAAEEDNVEAEWYIGHCYYEGLGVEKDDNEALLWFYKVSDCLASMSSHIDISEKCI